MVGEELLDRINEVWFASPSHSDDDHEQCVLWEGPNMWVQMMSNGLASHSWQRVKWWHCYPFEGCRGGAPSQKVSSSFEQVGVSDSHPPVVFPCFKVGCWSLDCIFGVWVDDEVPAHWNGCCSCNYCYNSADLVWEFSGLGFVYGWDRARFCCCIVCLLSHCLSMPHLCICWLLFCAGLLCGCEVVLQEYS